MDCRQCCRQPSGSATVPAPVAKSELPDLLLLESLGSDGQPSSGTALGLPESPAPPISMDAVAHMSLLSGVTAWIQALEATPELASITLDIDIGVNGHAIEPMDEEARVQVTPQKIPSWTPSYKSPKHSFRVQTCRLCNRLPCTRAGRGCPTMQPYTVVYTAHEGICLSPYRRWTHRKTSAGDEGQAHWRRCVNPADVGWAITVGSKEGLQLKPVLKGRHCRRVRADILAAALAPTSEPALHVGLCIMCSNEAWTIQAVTIPL